MFRLISFLMFSAPPSDWLQVLSGPDAGIRRASYLGGPSFGGCEDLECFEPLVVFGVFGCFLMISRVGPKSLVVYRAVLSVVSGS